MKFCALLAASLLLICCTAASLLLASNVNAQEPSRVHADGIQILLIADNPFSGLYSIDSTQKQDDGSPKTVHVDTNVARDQQGRIYREHRSVAPSDSEKESAIADGFILDAVSHTRTSCNVAARHCNVARYHGPSFLKPTPRRSARSQRSLRYSQESWERYHRRLQRHRNDREGCNPWRLARRKMADEYAGVLVLPRPWHKSICHNEGS